jgi:hypothetical protein
VCAKASGKNGGGGGGDGGCLLIGTVRFKSLSLDRCQGFKYSTPKKGRMLQKKNPRGTGGAYKGWLLLAQNEVMESAVLPPRTFVALQFRRHQNNTRDASSDISSWATGAMTETWRESTYRDGTDRNF